MKSFRHVISYFLGWPGLAALIVILVSVGVYLDATGFSEVKGQAAIRSLLAKHSLKAEGYTFFYASDGEAVGKVGQNYDVGTWEALDKVYCEQWQIWGDGIRRCWSLEVDGDRVKRTGSGYPFNENDAPVNELKRVEGNQIYSR